MFDKPSSRTQGVLTNSRTRVTGAARGKEHPPGLLLGLVPGEIFMLSFSGSDGQAHQTMIFKFGDVLLWDKRNGENYVSQNLEPVPERLIKQIAGRLAVAEQEGPGVPLKDQVDVMGDGGEAQEATPEPPDPSDRTTQGRIATALASGRPGLVPPPQDPAPPSREPLVKTPGVNVRQVR